jgi:putative pyruvate formate lyase activating enzyme
VEKLRGTVDIFLPDLKFCDPEIAGRYANAPDYFERAAAAIDRMMKITGPPVFDERGIMTRGTLVRHMVMPGATKDSMRILSYLAETYGKDIYVSIMSQYTPMPGIEKRYPELGRRITRREYEKVVDYALNLGLMNAYIQERETAKESFIPAFDGTGV